jgi:hypothetical protein
MFPPQLLDFFRRREVVLYIGAGLSSGAGLPGWADLVRPLAKSIGVHWPTNEADLTVVHLLSAIQHYENQRGRNALIQALRDNLDTTGKNPTPTHNLLIGSLPIQVIFTTNYDDLVERTLRRLNRPFNVVVNEPELVLWREDHIQVIKLCGELDQPESIIISQRDFNTFFSRRPRLTERLRTILESKTGLFLGYSLQDPFFNQVWDNIGLAFGSLRRLGFAVLFDPNPLEVKDLQNRGVQVIALNSNMRKKSDVLEEWSKDLVRML